MWFTSERATLLSGPANPTKASTQQRSATLQYIIILQVTGYDYLEALLLSTFSISILQVRELCLTSLQQLQRLSARTLFVGVSRSPRLPPSFSAIKSDTLLTVRVSSARTYCLLQVLRFVSVLTAS
jgi:hypothetical protein